MIILGFDTSTKSSSVSIIKDGEILGEVIINDKRTHSQKIMPILENLLNLANIDIEDIDIMAVSIGPGSFTGIRIALATVKAIAHVRNISIVSVNSLECLAYGVKLSDRLIIPVIDAQRDQVYTAAYRYEDGCRHNILECSVKSVDEVVDFINKNGEKVLLVGEATSKFGDKLGGDLIEVSDSIYNIPKASSICMMGLEKYHNNEDVCTCYDLEALYIRKSQAEVQYEERLKRDV